MTNIAVRKDDKPAPMATPAEAFRWEPFRMFRDLMSWDPFREMTPSGSPLSAGFSPSFEIKETKDGYVFKADVPGIKENDIEVTLTGNRLTVSGKRDAEKQEQTDTYYTYERSYGSFVRSFTLPEGVDTNSAHAELKDGVLTLALKRTPETQPRKIAVQSAAQKG